jgi:O-acetyl-ADP-ribose deacetylase (regulator of RNase III)
VIPIKRHWKIKIDIGRVIEIEHLNLYKKYIIEASGSNVKFLPRLAPPLQAKVI